jgi:hypothetical protein
MVTLPNPDYLKDMHETGKANGQDPGIDPKIADLAEFLDRAIRTKNTTIGTVVAAVGILLGRTGGDPDNLERLIYDVTTAVRVGFYLHLMKRN